MRSLELRTAAVALYALALATSGCVNVNQDPPFSLANFTVAEFNPTGVVDPATCEPDPTTSRVPFPILSPCRVDPNTGNCASRGTFNPAKGRVELPIVPCTAPNTPPGCDSPTSAALKAGLNTLDGFSTYGELRTTIRGSIDAASLTRQTAFLVDLGPGPTAGRIADFSPTAVTAGGQTTILFRPDRPDAATARTLGTAVTPLRPNATYAAVITRGVRDAAGKPIEPDATFALLRSRTPLACDGTADYIGCRDPRGNPLPAGTPIPNSLLANRSACSLGCSGPAAQQEACAREIRAALEATRKTFDQILSGLERNPAFKRENVALLWPTKTLSATNDLVNLRAALIKPCPPGTPNCVPTVMTRIPQLGFPGGSTHPNVQRFENGCILSPLLLRRPTETFRPAPGGVEVQPHFIPYVVSIPKNVSPPYKVVIWGHGFRGWRYSMMQVADALAEIGYATIAIDFPWHGDRTNLVLGGKDANGNPVTGTEITDPTRCIPRLPTSPEANDSSINAAADCPGGTAAPETVAGSQCPANAPADPQTGACQGGAPKIPSGAKMHSLNLFATRDNYRQAVIDLMQLVQVLRTPQQHTGGQLEFDPDNVVYVGQSLGAIIGTLFLATEPLVRTGVLNVGGAGFVNIVRETRCSICKPLVDGISAIGACDRPDPVNRPCECTPNAASLQFFHIAQWVVDPADPINYANHLVENPLWCRSATGATVPCAVAGGTPIPHKVLIQKVVGDTTIPNSTTHALRGAAGSRTCYREYTGASHGFLTSTDPADAAAREKALRELAIFIGTGGAATGDDLPADACP